MNKYRTLIILSLFLCFEIVNAQLPKPDNYIIFVDFSARIETNDQRLKDTELLSYLMDKFKFQVESLYKSGKIYSEDKISVLFYPDLNEENIIDLTSSMKIDFSKMDFNKKLKYYMSEFPKNEKPVIMNSFNKLYDIALQQNPNYFGSNIYDFFNYGLNNYLLETHNNHIVLFTDGYMYMTGENPKNIGNKKGHLEGSILDPLRANSNWEKLYVDQEWGIVSSGFQITKGTTISILEINPDNINNVFNPRTRIRPLESCPTEFKILSRFWKDWFLDMGFESKDINIHKTSNNLNGVKSDLDLLFRK
jgi:hypothetical protein